MLTGQGNGSVQDDDTTDDASDDTGNYTDSGDDDDEDEEDDPVKKLSHEARNRRLQNKLLRVEVAVRDVIADMELSKTQRKYVLKMFDPSSIKYVDGKPQGVDRVVKDLLSDFEADFGEVTHKRLPSQGGKGNVDKNKSTQPTRQELIRKYPSLGGGMGNPAKWAGR